MFPKAQNTLYYPLTIFFALCFSGFAGAVFVTFQQATLVETRFLATARASTLSLINRSRLQAPKVKSSASLKLEEVFTPFSDRVKQPDIQRYIIDTTLPTAIIYDLDTGKILKSRDAEALFSIPPLFQFREEINAEGRQWTVFIIPTKGAFKVDPTLAILIQVIAISTGIILAYVMRKAISQTNRLRTHVFRRISKLKEHLHLRKEPEANNRLLNVVMDTLTQGICAFSQDMTLLKWNTNLKTILDLPKGTVKEGILYKVLTKHLDQISYQTAENGERTSLGQPINEESFLEQDINYFERNLQDGRTLEVTMRPMPDRGFIVVYSDITQRKKAERVIRHMAHFDSLTGLANRAYFAEKLSGLLSQKRQGDETVALALIDLDKFKEVNDTHGHPMGDALLQRVSEILKSHVRDHDFVARIGGDEFAILFPNTSEIKEVIAPLNRILATLKNPISVRGDKLNIGASIGISLYPRHASTMESLIKAADDALYSVKQNGRGNIKIAPRQDQSAKTSII